MTASRVLLERLITMPKQPFVSIPLDIPDVQVLQTDLTKAGEFIVTVESTLTSTSCRRCGRTITEPHGTDQPRLLRHLPILGQPDWYDPKALHTKAYERHLIVQLINSTLTDVTEKEDVSYVALLGVLDRWIASSIDWQALPPCHTLGIDEIALLKGHRDYIAVITARDDAGELPVVAVLPDRLKTTIIAWLSALPEVVRTRITTVCTDMWEGYVSAVEEALPSARIVIDRFHVARQYRAAIDTLRKQEVKRLQKELPEQQHDELKHILWPLRKPVADLSDDEAQRLKRLFELSPALEQAVTLREELTRIFESARSKADGLRRIGLWRARVERSGLTCFDPFLKLLDTCSTASRITLSTTKVVVLLKG